MTNATQTAVRILGAALLLSIGGIVALAWVGDRPIPDVLVAVATGCLTGLLGILAPSLGAGTGGDHRRQDA